MEEKLSLPLKISGKPAKEMQVSMHHIERREWWLWSSAVAVTLLLLIGIASFAIPGLMSQNDSSMGYSFSLSQTVLGLAGLVLIFNVYVIYQQLQLNRFRRELTEQVVAVDRVEILAQEIYSVAILDSLTGLYNRRYIEHRLSEELTRAQRSTLPLTVIVFDLDGFKQVNDKYGHAAGDALLKVFSTRLRKATRGSDLTARYGGDEFLALLPECRGEEVQYVLKRLEGIEIDVGGEMLPVSFSAGSADYIVGESAEELLSRADRAMYLHKNGAKGHDKPAAMSL
jgi:diguanylate cyclase (GGDEF)-like protein